MWSVPALIDNDKFGRPTLQPVQGGYPPCPSLAECAIDGWAPVAKLYPETPLVFLTVTDCFVDITPTSLKRPCSIISREAEVLMGYATNTTNFVRAYSNFHSLREKGEALEQRSRRRFGNPDCGAPSVTHSVSSGECDPDH